MRALVACLVVALAGCTVVVRCACAPQPAEPVPVLSAGGLTVNTASSFADGSGAACETASAIPAVDCGLAVMHYDGCHWSCVTWSLDMMQVTQ